MTDIAYDEWEPVIGLEIHVQLKTKSKLFSPAPNHFGDEPNSNISPVCTGQPGSLPVLNKEAVIKAIQFGLAINAEVALFSQFDRKSYFYPDSPRNFQITQFTYPIVIGGEITADVGEETKTFLINRAHLEDDAGMLKHFSSFAGVDDNRAGVPLLEIVSEPCIRSPSEAVAYAMAIRAIMQYIGGSDCNMEEGSLRIDANVSVRPKGTKEMRNKVEIKNMNSFNNMMLALEVEIRRQIVAYTLHSDIDPNDVIEQGTYRFDLEKKQTVLMRKKENAPDYRYFPEPDLPPLILTQGYIDAIKEMLPELPHQRWKRYVEKLGLSKYSASVLINDKNLSDYFEKGLATCKNPVALCNWITVEFIGRLKDTGKKLTELGIDCTHIANLINMIEENKITGKIAKKVVDDMLAHPGKDSIDIVKENPDYLPLSDTSLIEPIVTRVLEENPQAVADFKEKGKTKALAALVGQVMKETRGKASPSLVNQLLMEKINKK